MRQRSVLDTAATRPARRHRCARWLLVRLIFALGVSGVAFAPTDVLADPAAAERQFMAGAEAFRRHDYVTAANAFEAAHREEPAGAALYNAGLSWEAAGDHPRAADRYAGALDHGGLESKDEADARSRLQALESTLGLVLVGGEAGTTVSVGHVQQQSVPVRVHLRPAEYVVSARSADGRARSERVRVVASRQLDVELGSPAAWSAGDSHGGASEAPVATDHDRSERGAADDSPAAWPIAGGVTLGVGAAGAIVAIVLGVEALDARDEFEASGNTDADAHDRSASLRTATNVAWVASSVIAATGLAVLIAGAISEDDDPAAGPSARLDVGPTGARMRVAF